MKTIEVNTGKCRLLFVLPIEPIEKCRAVNFDGFSRLYILISGDNSNWVERQVEIPHGKWQDPIKVAEVTEEKASEVVESHVIPFYDSSVCYPDYQVYGKTGFKAFTTAIESFQSLLIANEIYLDNPMGKDELNIEDYFSSRQYYHFKRQWDKYQETTGNWIMLIDQL